MNDSATVLTLAAAIGAAVPIALAALGELLAEKSGVLNLGVEGMMLMGAVAAFLAADGTGNLWFALAMGTIAGAGLSLVHAFVCVTLRSNQIVSGLALTIFGTGLSTFLGKPVEGIPVAPDLVVTDLGALADLPLIGPVAFRQNFLVYGTVALALLLSWYLRRTRTGLALRAVGESPATADTMGIGVEAYRYVHVVMGGALAGLGGAYLVLALVPSWSQSATTAGIGWIAVALVVFGSWNPVRVLLGAFLFGFARRANFWLQGLGVDVAGELLSMLPYVLTIAVLVAVGSRDRRRRAGAPAALGMAYVRDER